MNETPVSLLERLRESPDNGAWQRLADLYLPLIHRWLNHHGLAGADADDLTQEILLTIVRGLPEFEHSGREGAFRAWLRMITVHRLRGYWRGKQSRPAQAVEPSSTSSKTRRARSLASGIRSTMNSFSVGCWR